MTAHVVVQFDLEGKDDFVDEEELEEFVTDLLDRPGQRTVAHMSVSVRYA